LIDLLLNYKYSAGRGELGTCVAVQTGKSKVDQGALRKGGCSWTYPNVFPMILAKGGSGRRAWERGTSSLMFRVSSPGDA
jgi:hypothetical protein